MEQRTKFTRTSEVGTLRALLVTAALTLAGPALAADDQVRDFVLDNGMEVVVIPDHREPIATHMVWYKVGSADEPRGKSGIAHFFEHLMFKATANHPAGEFDRAVSAVGGSNNAFTSYDFTAFHETVAPSALELMMSFEADRMRNLILTDKDIKTERDVILEERRMSIDDNPGAVLDEEVNATVWQNQPYRIQVLGWMQEMEQLNLADARAFYDKYYWPNNAVLIVAGDVEPENVRALAEKTYGKVARGPDLPPRVRPVEPEQNTRRTVTLTDARVSVPGFSTQWVVPSYHTAKPGEAEALELLADILGGGDRSRLYQELVVKQGIASSVGAYFQGAMLDDTTFTVYGAPRGDAKLSDVEAGVNAEVARIAIEGVSEYELQKAKDRYIASIIFAGDDPNDLANMYGSMLALGGNVQDVLESPDRIRNVTADQIKAAAVRYLGLDHSTTGYLLPQQKREGLI
ncbi:pitrilysin family protein [Mesorhizobium sp. WSM3224]|uniref:M16 family metallopeptidase n=1 Tax=Mesorhizobium sp. WSM3224 TaxID=1040986 RepID=UPI0005669058|nr:pitrilysin family protein [Mesorhizobium sp. WSM3224]